MEPSIAARVAELYLRRFGEILKSAEKTRAFLAQRMLEGDPPLPEKLLRGTDARLAPLAGGRMVVFGDEAAARCVVHMHGGAYATQANSAHISFCARLAARTGRCVYLPLYPLLPRHHCEEAFAFVDALWARLAGKAVALTGDSSGAGFVLSYAQMLRDRGAPLPERIISISPCVDAGMTSSDYAPYAARDALVGREGILVVGEAWANGLDIRDPRISPLFGDCRGLPPTTLFAGTEEVLFPDVALFARKLAEEGVASELIVGEGLGHIYPLQPIPEADAAFEQIVQRL